MSDSRRNAGHSQAQWGVKWFTRQAGRRKRFGERKHVLVRITKIYVTAVTSPRPSEPFLRVPCFRVSTRRSDTSWQGGRGTTASPRWCSRSVVSGYGDVPKKGMIALDITICLGSLTLMVVSFRYNSHFVLLFGMLTPF